MNFATAFRDFTAAATATKLFADVQEAKSVKDVSLVRGWPLLVLSPSYWSRRRSIIEKDVLVQSLTVWCFVVIRDDRGAIAPDLDKLEDLRTALTTAANAAAALQTNVAARVTFGRYAYASSKYPEFQESIQVRFVENDDGGDITAPPDGIP